MKLNDEVIAHIAKQLQLAILTGTDIVDNLRMIQLQEEGGQLYLDPEYVLAAEENEKRMIEEAQKLAKQMDN
jgi:hypothetical protein|tara:strand:+ start:302 stop:517 length:216 start_codon:yes stop_codon:yes gene_type:complete